MDVVKMNDEMNDTGDSDGCPYMSQMSCTNLCHADNKILNGMNGGRYSGKKSVHKVLMYIFQRSAVLWSEGKGQALNAPVRWHCVAQLNRLVVNLFTLAQMRQGHGGKWEIYKELSQDLTSHFFSPA